MQAHEVEYHYGSRVHFPAAPHDLPIFDSVLIVSFGGPQGPDDIRPFLANVLRGRRVSPGRVEEVAHHYELFGGVSPITALTLRQAEGLRRASRRLAIRCRCTWGCATGIRSWRIRCV